MRGLRARVEKGRLILDEPTTLTDGTVRHDRPSPADLWVQASPDQKQQLQQLFFGEGRRFSKSGTLALQALHGATASSDPLSPLTPALWLQRSAKSARNAFL
jgi:hypothetical protein